MRIRIVILFDAVADPDPNFHPDADADPDPDSLQNKGSNL
jgi:hypothetical protein